MLDMDNVLSVKMMNGSSIDINVLDIVEGVYNNINKKYIVYSFVDKDDIMVSILNESADSFSLDNIDDEQEFKYVENLLIELNKGDLDE